jgi:acetate---CoA ligase (ADP-forming)
MLNPQSMAIVGASDRQPNWRGVIDQNEAAGVTVRLVNPNREQVFGMKAYPTLEDVGEAVDTVVSLVNAELTVGVVESAARVGARSVVITAAGFGETDDAGKERQRRIAEIAQEHDIAICGPNCTGIVNVVGGKSMTARLTSGIRPGGVALVSQSGGLVTALVAAGAERKLGFNYLISSGNEAATDMVDYLNVLIDDPDVTTITLIIEEIRRPAEFILAAYRARAAGKPLIAFKLGRSESGKRMGASHTGAMMGDARDYDALFRQLGVLVAKDLDDLLDLALLFSSIPRQTWRRAQRVGVLCASGGSASICSDAFEAENLPLIVDDQLASWMQELIPTNALGNPFDTTGLLYNEKDFENVLQQYLVSTVYDTVFVASSGLGPTHEQLAMPLIGPLKRAAGQGDKRIVIASSAASVLGDWTEQFIDAGVGVGRGIVPAVRSLKAMDRFLEIMERPIPEAVTPTSQPDDFQSAVDGSNRILRFSDAARLARQYGIPVAPFVEFDPNSSDVEVALSGLPPTDLFVVKLANSLHRSDIGGVATGVKRDELTATATRMSSLAERLDLSRDVLIQPQLRGRGEVLIGAQSASPLGPIVLFGLGGIFVEALADVSARSAPFTRADATDMLAEIRAHKVLYGIRGQQPWDTAALVDILVGFGQLAAATSGWLESIEINPLMVTDTGYAAVDISCILRPRSTHDAI